VVWYVLNREVHFSLTVLAETAQNSQGKTMANAHGTKEAGAVRRKALDSYVAVAGILTMHPAEFPRGKTNLSADVVDRGRTERAACPRLSPAGDRVHRCNNLLLVAGTA
jgi:hypothetical protein